VKLRGARCAFFALLACSLATGRASVAQGRVSGNEDELAELRARMVEEQIERRGVGDLRVLAAMRSVPRHLFMPEEFRHDAYADAPQPIGEGQTISQPYIVGLMTSLLELRGDEKVLEVGTGSGYQAAILAKVTRHVYTIEILAPLAERARKLFDELRLHNIRTRVGDGYQGWPDAAPFDAIIVTAAPEEIPPPLVAQLKIGGRMVIPVGRTFQDLQVLTKTREGFLRRTVLPVRFVPMTGEAQQREATPPPPVLPPK
jgi:protein-L-isoaspartate(D-aspartate) O-methyltransferase